MLANETTKPLKLVEIQYGEACVEKTLNEEIKPFKIFIGWDSREDIAYQVWQKSILDTATVPVEIIPLKQKF